MVVGSKKLKVSLMPSSRRDTSQKPGGIPTKIVPTPSSTTRVIKKVQPTEFWLTKDKDGLNENERFSYGVWEKEPYHPNKLGYWYSPEYRRGHAGPVFLAVLTFSLGKNVLPPSGGCNKVVLAGEKVVVTPVKLDSLKRIPGA
mgnify:CR=1 FL=1